MRQRGGRGGDPNWSTVDPAAVPFPGAPGGAVIAALQHGDPAGQVWRPAETDVSIRPGWFHHAAEDERVKTVDQLESIWYTSVGRNSKLLLNVPPTRDGVLHPTDLARLSLLRVRLTSTFAEDLVAGRPVRRRATGARSVSYEIDIGRTVSASVVRLGEDIAHGQTVARYAVYGADDADWSELARGTTIGYRKLERFAPLAVRRLRVDVEDALELPRGLTIGLHAGV